MYSKVYSAAVRGLSGQLVTVEADLSDGLPGFDMVGALSGEVKEAMARVRTALKNNGFRLPPKKVVVNLAPAHCRRGPVCPGDPAGGVSFGDPAGGGAGIVR